jgi:phosphoglycerol transferase MdoB-like AlkP superfamily enzyme
LINFVGGIRFDLSVIFYSNILIIILHTIPGNFKYSNGYQKILKHLFYWINLIFLGTNFVDFIYYTFTGKRSTWGLITASGMEQEIGGLLPSFAKQYWYVLITFLIFAFLLWKFTPKAYFISKQNINRKQIFIQIFIFLMATGSCILFGRGGTQRKPIRRVDAIKYAQSKNSPIVLNTPFCILKTLNRNKDLKLLEYFTEKEIDSLYTPLKDSKNLKSFNKKNVVVFILESFGDESISYSNPETGNTPFLDSLISKSLYFKNGFANGRVSIDAVPSVISGIPSIIGQPYISSNYAFNEVNSLPLLFKNEGYHTSFFHGSFNGSQNFDQFSKIAGFHEYYGKNEYPDKNPEHYDGKWGVFDEEFLQFFGQKLSTFKEPFFSSLFTISAHSPFIIPKKHKGKFKKGATLFQETVGYTDYSLRKFFEYAKKQKWYNNTLFVLTSDHCSGINKKFYKSIIQEYSIPFIFFDPSNNDLKGVSLKNFQQIDILPSVLDYLNYNKKYISYGNSFKTKSNFIVNYINNSFHIATDDYYFIFDGIKIVELYNFKTDENLKNNLILVNKKLVSNLETKAKAYLQSFNNNLIKNKLTVQ